MNKVVKLFVCTIILMSQCFISIAGEWKESYHDNLSGHDLINVYEYEDGSIIKDSWRWIDDNNDGKFECHFFDANGKQQKACTPNGGYYINKEGLYSKNYVDPVTWIPTEEELLDIWNNNYYCPGSHIDEVDSYFYIDSINDEGFTLSYIHRDNNKKESFVTSEYKMKWTEGKTGAVYSKIENGTLIDYMELAIDPQFGLDAIMYSDITRLDIVRLDLKLE